MPLWKSTDLQASAPKFTVNEQSNTGVQQYGNTIFAVDATEQAVTAGVVSPGWVKRTRGTGPVTNITISDGGTLYDNADTIEVEAGAPGGVNAEANIVTDANGTITSIVISENGSGMYGDEVAVITTSTGNDAVLAVTFGGRSGRIKHETLVSLAITGADGSDDAAYPDS